MRMLLILHCFLMQHSSVDGFVEPPVPPTKSASRHSLPRCRNSFTSTEEQPHIGNYRLLKTIGKGNFAKVKLARHVLTGREVTGVFLNPLDIAVVSICNISWCIFLVNLLSISLSNWLFCLRSTISVHRQPTWMNILVLSDQESKTKSKTLSLAPSHQYLMIWETDWTFYTLHHEGNGWSQHHNTN